MIIFIPKFIIIIMIIMIILIIMIIFLLMMIMHLLLKDQWARQETTPRCFQSLQEETLVIIVTMEMMVTLSNIYSIANTFATACF